MIRKGKDSEQRPHETHHTSRRDVASGQGAKGIEGNLSLTPSCEVLVVLKFDWLEEVRVDWLHRESENC